MSNHFDSELKVSFGNLSLKILVGAFSYNFELDGSPFIPMRITSPFIYIVLDLRIRRGQLLLS